MCSWVITAPKELPQEHQKDFFKLCYEFLKNRYDTQENNVISAYVHLDEITPHLHYAFIPITFDPKKNKEKVSAKEVITKKDLQSFHEDLQTLINERLIKSNHYTFECNILNGATRNGNKSIEELKRQSATERLNEVNQKASEIVFKAHMEVQGVKDSLIPIKAEYEAKKAYIRQVDDTSHISVMYPSQAKIKEKGFLHKQKFVTVPIEIWEAKHISANEKDYLKKFYETFEQNIEAFYNTNSAKNIDLLSNRIKELEQENQTLKGKNQQLETQIKLLGTQNEKIIDKINSVLQKLPQEFTKEFVDIWNTSQKNNNLEMER